jgi:hypothetical protein
MVCRLIELDLSQFLPMHLIGCYGLPDMVQLCVDVKVASRRGCPSRQSQSTPDIWLCSYVLRQVHIRTTLNLYVRSQHRWSLHTYHLTPRYPIETEHLVLEERSMPLFVDFMMSTGPLTYAI